MELLLGAASSPTLDAIELSTVLIDVICGVECLSSILYIVKAGVHGTYKCVNR